MRVGIEEEALAARADIAVRGVRMDAPVQRSKGAGPSDDGHLVVNGANAALPLRCEFSARARSRNRCAMTSSRSVSLRMLVRNIFRSRSVRPGA